VQTLKKMTTEPMQQPQHHFHCQDAMRHELMGGCICFLIKLGGVDCGRRQQLAGENIVFISPEHGMGCRSSVNRIRIRIRNRTELGFPERGRCATIPSDGWCRQPP